MILTIHLEALQMLRCVSWSHFSPCFFDLFTFGRTRSSPQQSRRTSLMQALLVTEEGLGSVMSTSGCRRLLPRPYQCAREFSMDTDNK